MTPIPYDEMRRILGLPDVRPAAPYQLHRRFERGERVVFEDGNGFRYSGVVVDVQERGGEVTYTTEDPRFSPRAFEFAAARDRHLRGEGEPLEDILASQRRSFEQLLVEAGIDIEAATVKWRDPETPQQRHQNGSPETSKFDQFSGHAEQWDQVLRGYYRRVMFGLGEAPITQFPQRKPDTRTPQERALPRPSHTPPMWANDPTRTRRAKHKPRRRVK